MIYDEKIFNKAYKDYKPRIRNYLIRKYGYNSNIDDLINDAFISAQNYIEQFDPNKSSLKTWITNIAENKVKREYKRNKIKTISLDVELEDGYNSLHDIIADPYIPDDPEEQLLLKLKAELVIEAIYSLEDKYKDILILREIEGFSYLELVEILNININTAKSRVKKGRILVIKKVNKQFKLLDKK